MMQENLEKNLAWFRVPQKIYFRRGALPIALRELQNFRKNVLILTDTEHFRKGSTRPIEQELFHSKIRYSVFPVEETLQSVSDGVDFCRKNAIDCLLAVGNIAVTAGKLIRILAENPELPFSELSERVNLRDRSLNVLHTGKIYFIAVAAGDFVGDEVSPFSMKVPLSELGVQDYALLPDMSVIDIDLIQKQDVKAVAFTSMIALRSAAYVFLSKETSDYAKGLAVHAVRVISEQFPEYCRNPENLSALERLSCAAEMASMAFSNVYDGNEQQLSEVINWNVLAEELQIPAEQLEKQFHDMSETANFALS